MGILDVLQQYRNATTAPDPSATPAHFDEVASAAPPGVFGQGVGDALRSDDTPPFGDMVSQLFGRSDPQQRAGVVNQLLRSLAPGVLASLGGGLLGRLGGPAQPVTPAVSQGVPPTITPEQAAQLSPTEVRDIAAQAEKHDPSVFDRIGGFYAQHPQLVKTLGQAAMTIALAGVARRMI